MRRGESLQISAAARVHVKLTTTGRLNVGIETFDKFMRRLALIFGILLTLTAGVWSSALAAAGWCLHEASAPVASDGHDCCRVRTGESNAHHSEAPEDSHEATHEESVSQNQVVESHAEMNCEGAEESARQAKATAFGERGLSCFECCANRPGQTPTTATVVAPEQNKVKRAADNVSVSARDLFAPTVLDVSHLAPSQHAPPPTAKRRHMLISVFLI